eukprot:c10067_g3_i1.p1 GENE.c10067_g3_i1~~c10067_g3_i1.p1  ORF type:complete len:267 (-),score=66.65 c10067_g3_i1:782-1582(-)
MLLNKAALCTSRTLVVSCARRNVMLASSSFIRPSTVSHLSPLARPVQHTRGFFGNKSETETTKEEKTQQDEGIKAPTEEVDSAAQQELQATIEAQKEQIKALEQKLKESEEKLRQEHHNYMRAVADMENVRRIASKDVDNSKKFALTSFAKEVLDVADNLARAVQAVPESVRQKEADDECTKTLNILYEGVVMTENIFQGVLKKKGITRYSPQVGDKFDPNVHMATFKVPSDKFDVGTIAHCMTDGYMIHERVLRAAVVGVHEKPQ